MIQDPTVSVPSEGWRVTYRNEGRPEQTQIFADKAAALETAEFLRWQGATAVKIVSV
jgi:hypothetical protein